MSEFSDMESWAGTTRQRAWSTSLLQCLTVQDVGLSTFAACCEPCAMGALARALPASAHPLAGRPLAAAAAHATGTGCCACGHTSTSFRGPLHYALRMHLRASLGIEGDPWHDLVLTSACPGLTLAQEIREVARYEELLRERDACENAPPYGVFLQPSLSLPSYMTRSSMVQPPCLQEAHRVRTPRTSCASVRFADLYASSQEGSREGGREGLCALVSPTTSPVVDRRRCSARSTDTPRDTPPPPERRASSGRMLLDAPREGPLRGAPAPPERRGSGRTLLDAPREGPLRGVPAPPERRGSGRSLVPTLEDIASPPQRVGRTEGWVTN